MKDLAAVAAPTFYPRQRPGAGAGPGAELSSDTPSTKLISSEGIDPFQLTASKYGGRVTLSRPIPFFTRTAFPALTRAAPCQLPAHFFLSDNVLTFPTMHSVLTDP